MKWLALLVAVGLLVPSMVSAQSISWAATRV